MHRGASLLQQPGGHRQPEGPQEAQSMPLQEGNRDLQLLLLQHHPGRQAQPTGRRAGAKKSLSDVLSHAVTDAMLSNWCLPLTGMLLMFSFFWFLCRG